MVRFEKSSILLNRFLTIRVDPSYSELVAAKRKQTWGGARKGAGRPREIQDPVRVTIDFERKDFEELRELSDQIQISASSLIRDAVRRLIRRARRP